MRPPFGLFPAGGFTRMEALMMTVGLSVLGSLALPLVAGNAEHARTAVCLDNLRRLAVAHAVYATEFGWYAPNPDDGNATPGFSWVPGIAGPGGVHEFDSAILADPSRSLLFPYVGESGVRVFACPADGRLGRAPRALASEPRVSAARTVVMSQAVGVNPYARVRQAVDGPWLDSNHGHTLGRTWRTYGKPEDVVGPTPGGLLVFLDEDVQSLNDGTFAFGMETPEWLDWPGTRHGTGATVGFADAHAEVRRWVEPSTQVVGGFVQRRRVPGSVDYAWVRERISAPLTR